MKTLKNLAWVVVGLLNITLGYFLWTYAAFEAGGVVISLIGTAIIVEAVADMRRPKVVRYVA